MYILTEGNILSQSTAATELGSSHYPLGHSEDFEDEPLRSFNSAGYLMGASGYMVRRKGRGDSPVSMSKESSMIIEGMMKARRYSPEEKRERIERYRSKRNHRNFKRKIQYECRKIIADRRTRVKGRFVRNDEISTMMRMMDDNDHYSSTHRCHTMAKGEEGDEGEENSWFNLLDYSFPPQY